MVFRWREGFPNRGVLAAVVGKEIERILMGVPDERVKPDMLVEAARNSRSPLHPMFDWDDNVAAEKWRKEQAGELLRAVVVIQEIDGVKTAVRRFAYIPSEENRGYTTMAFAMKDPESADLIVAESLRYLEGWQRRFGIYSQLREEAAAVASLIERHKKKAKGACLVGCKN